MQRVLRSAILAAADSDGVRRFVTRHGMRLGARRFVAGETAGEFLDVARAVNRDGFAVACGILGEGVTSEREANDAASQYCELLTTFAREGIDANVAFKLTHVGLEVDPELAYENAARIAQTALDTNNTMRIDMEQSAYVDRTLEVYRRLRARYECVGFVLQSYLRRAHDDLEAMLPLSPSVRLVKGAYLEPPELAFPDKSDVDAEYVRLARTALSHPGYTAIATHDPAVIAQVETIVSELDLPKRGRFEFQMLYGIAPARARALVERGYRVRLAVPFGNFWFPYLMRRLAERPANLAFFLKGALGRG